MLALLVALQAVVAPPPMPITDCFTPGPFVVFFDRDAAVLSEEATTILDNLVRREADACGGFGFSITGHADRGERRAVDRGRAAAVRAYLARQGLRRWIGPVRGVGASVPRIARPAGVAELQNRRVVIEALPDR